MSVPNPTLVYIALALATFATVDVTRAAQSTTESDAFSLPVDKDRVGQTLNFVSCPMVRNTAHPCWLAEYEGELYYLGVQGSTLSEFYPPQLKHKALIEGVISDQPRQCGGIVLSPAKVSTMRELDLSCNSILPAENYVIETNERAPGPAGAQQPPRREKEPEPTSITRREYVIGFDFDVLRPWIGQALEIGKAADYAMSINAKRVEVIGYRGFAQLTNGEVLEELPQLAEQRAKRVATALVDIGVDESVLHVTHIQEAVGPSHELRRVLVIITP